MKMIQRSILLIYRIALQMKRLCVGVYSGVKCLKCLHLCGRCLLGSVSGYFGRDCVDVCLLNPCEHTSSCVRKPTTKHGYTCECGHNYYGRYCEHR